MAAACSYDAVTGGRVLDGHRDDCTDWSTHSACLPCTAPHCVVCGRGHATNDHPLTCVSCVAQVRDDLEVITVAYDDLETEAIDGTRDGRMAAAASIPGAVAQVLRGPAVPMGQVVASEHFEDDHRAGDEVPPLAVLAWWEDIYRTHLGVPTAARATVPAAVMFFLQHLSSVAQDTGGPDWWAFTREVRALRSQLQRVLHDEQAPQVGVECFECGARLVRWFRDVSICRHGTPARDELATWLALGYPEAVPVALVRAARRPCGRCDQGGIKDPAVGLSWECPGCRRDYSAGEYVHAVRRDLLAGSDGAAGWCAVSVAAEAVSTLLGETVGVSTVRKWMDRGRVQSQRSGGGRLVFWPDVADAALSLVERRRDRLTKGRAS